MTDAEIIAWDVARERARQDLKWGEQNHPDGTAASVAPLLFAGINTVAGDLAELAKVSTDHRVALGTVTWRDILLEELFEALAEKDRDRLQEELVQVAAVCQQWAEAILRARRAEAIERMGRGEQL